MAGHTSEKRWDRNKFGDAGIGEQVKNSCVQMLLATRTVEDVYQDLLELWTYAGGTDQEVADQLFYDIWSIRETIPGTPDTGANAVEISQVADAKAAMSACHQLYQTLTNVAVPQRDRITTLRRMT